MIPVVSCGWEAPTKFISGENNRVLGSIASEKSISYSMISFVPSSWYFLKIVVVIILFSCDIIPSRIRIRL